MLHSRRANTAPGQAFHTKGKEKGKEKFYVRMMNKRERPSKVVWARFRRALHAEPGVRYAYDRVRVPYPLDSLAWANSRVLAPAVAANRGVEPPKLIFGAPEVEGILTAQVHPGA